MNKEEKKSQNVDFKTLIDFTKGKQHYVIMSVILSSMASICSFIPYYSIYRIVELLLRNYNDLSVLGPNDLVVLGWYAFIGVALNVLLYFLALVCSHLAAFGTLYNLKINFTRHLANVPLGFHILMGSGKLRKIMDDNIEKIEGFIAHQLPDIVAAIVAPIVAIIIMFYVDYRYALCVFLGLIFISILQSKMYGKEGVSGMMEEYQTLMDNMNNSAVEYIRGISVIKAFNQTIDSFKALKEVIHKATSANMKYTLKWKVPMSLFLTIIYNLYLFVVPLGIYLVTTTDDYINTVTTFIFYLMFVPSLGGILTKTMYASMGSVRIFMGTEKMMRVLEEPVLEKTNNPKEINNYDIEFKNVIFSYDNENNALDNVSFIAKENTITALVGPSGGGKSTIAHLIPRFYDVTKGSISIGGVNVKDMSFEYLMDKVSFVFQDVYLFKQSLLENIRLGNPNASDNDVINAAKAARCHEFIENLEHGYNTIIGENGAYLSGGEMQRVAIARAIIKNSPIIVLDEATAFADPENEYLIQEALVELLKNKTVIIIAHRLYTIKNADNIIVLNDGKINESGTHNTLINNDGLYKHMWESYTQSKGWTMNNKGGNN